MRKYHKSLDAQGKPTGCYYDFLWDWYGLEPWQIPDETGDEDESTWGTTFHLDRKPKKTKPSTVLTHGGMAESSNADDKKKPKKKTVPKQESSDEDTPTANEWTLIQKTSKTRLASGRNSILVDIGSRVNLIGSEAEK